MWFIWTCFVICSSADDWGFFGHTLINRAAVYTIPSEMIDWYKPHIDYLAEHAVDPDKRRYATKHEAVRHYIDLDQWGTLPFDHIPRTWDVILANNISIYSVSESDTTFLVRALPVSEWKSEGDSISARRNLVRDVYLKKYYDDLPSVSCDTIQKYFPEVSCKDGTVWLLADDFSPHGILPYHLLAMQRRLTNAFREKNMPQVLRISAEIGHYIGDACVPLHTTKNYNGQLTDQVGIHGFWESRIPELFALDEFDLVVGGASYIEDPLHHYWDLVIDSHKDVADVLRLERELKESFPPDQQFCFDDRLQANIRTQCREFALAYHIAMNRMVEDRFRLAIKSVADAWYTAWIDAGQPEAPEFYQANRKSTEDEELENAVKSGKVIGREHDN